MKFVSVRELRNETNKVVETAGREDVIITAFGKPKAVLLKMTEEDLEDYILAKHLGLERMVESLDRVKLIPGKTIERKYRKRPRRG